MTMMKSSFDIPHSGFIYVHHHTTLYNQKENTNLYGNGTAISL